MVLFIFQQSSIICIGRHFGGHTLVLQQGDQNYFLLISCYTFDSYYKGTINVTINVTTSSFQYFP